MYIQYSCGDHLVRNKKSSNLCMSLSTVKRGWWNSGMMTLIFSPSFGNYVEKVKHEGREKWMCFQTREDCGLVEKRKSFSDFQRLVSQGIHWQQQMEKMWNFIIFCHFHLLNPIAEGTTTTSTLFKTDSLIYGYCVFQGEEKSLFKACKTFKCTIYNLSKANFSSIRQDLGFLL